MSFVQELTDETAKVTLFYGESIATNIRPLAVRKGSCHCSSGHSNDHMITEQCHMFSCVFLGDVSLCFRTNDMLSLQTLPGDKGPPTHAVKTKALLLSNVQHLMQVHAFFLWTFALWIFAITYNDNLYLCFAVKTTF